jgi:ribosomal-protein-alanine N-acetyltransferase
MEDLPTILTLERGAEGPHWSEDQFREAIAGGGGAVRRRVFVWDEVGFSVGMVLAVGGVAEGELEHVVVKAEARRAGVGRALCDAVVGWTRELGCERVRLEVRAANPAVRMYEGLGFRVVGRRKGYYQGPVEDAVLMEM